MNTLSNESIQHIVDAEAWKELSYDVHWTEALLEKFQDKVDWQKISESEICRILWTIPMIQKFKNRLNWDAFSLHISKESLTEECIQTFAEKWNWSNLSGNGSLSLTEELIDKFIDRWDWVVIINRGYYHDVFVARGIEFYEKYKEYIPTESLHNSNLWDHIVLQRKKQLMAEWTDQGTLDKMNTLSNESMQHIVDAEAWKELSYDVPWTEALLEKFQDKVDWQEISESYRILWTIPMIQKFKNRLNWDAFSDHINEESLTEECIQTFAEKWNWSNLSGNSHLSLTEELIDKFIDRWDWKEIINRGNYHNVFEGRGIEFYEKYKEYIPTESLHYSNLWHHIVDQRNKQLMAEGTDQGTLDKMNTLSNESMQHIVDAEAWKELPYDEPLTEALLEKFQDKVDWQAISENTSILWTIPMIQKFKNRLNWDDFSLYINKESLTEECIQTFAEKWNWSNLSGNNHLSLTEELIDKFIDRWDWEGIINRGYPDDPEFDPWFEPLFEDRGIEFYEKYKEYIPTESLHDSCLWFYIVDQRKKQLMAE